MSNLKQWLTAGAAICTLSVAGLSQAQVVHEETKSGQASKTLTVTTSASLTGKNGQLYLAAISTKPKLTVTAVSGLGLNWMPVKAQCSGRGITGVEVWMAQGIPQMRDNSAVTATLADTASNAIIAVSRYSGVHATSPLGNVISGNTTGSPGACEGGVDNAAYSFKLTTTSNDAAVYGVATMRTKSHTPGAGYTERLDIQQGGGKNMVSIAVQDQVFASASRVAIDGSFSGIVDWSVVAMEIRPSSAVGSTKYKLTTNTVGSGSVSLNPPGGTYEAGTVVTLTATPAADFKFSGWSGDLNSSDNPATIIVNVNKNVTANFKSAPYKLTVNILGPGSVTLDPPGGSYSAGTVVTLRAIPSPGFQFSGWDGDLAGLVNPSTITAINANQSVTAIFTGGAVSGQIIHKETQAGVASNSATVKTSANLLGTKGQLYLAAISTKPKMGVTSVSGLGLNWMPVKAQCSGSGLSGVEVWMAQGTSTGNSVVTATLAGVASNAIIVVSRYFGVHATSPLGNVISGNTTGSSGSCADGVDNPAYSLNLATTSDDAVVYGAATMRSQTHKPGAGYREWADFQQGSGSNIVSLALEEKKVASTSTVTVDGSFDSETDWAVVAVEIRPLSATGTPKFTLTKSKVGSGSVSSNPSTAVYNAGTVVTLTATPAAGFEFSHWSGDLNSSANPATITMNVNKNVTANFTSLFYKLTVNTIGSGNVTINPPEGPYAAGTVVTLTAAPSAGFQFNFWGGALTGSTNPATFTIGVADKSVKAIFKESNVSGQVVHAETGTGVASNSATVTTSGNLAGINGQLYLAAISTRPKISVTEVSGLGLSWTLVKAQCSGRDLSGVEVWMAQGNSTGSGAVTATLAGAAANAIIVVSRYSGMHATNPLGNVISGNMNGATESCTGGVDIGAYSLDLATTANNAIVFSAATMRSQTHTPGGGYTEWAEFQQGSGGNIVSLAVQEKSVASASTVTVNGTFNGNVDWAVVAVEIKPRPNIVVNTNLAKNKPATASKSDLSSPPANAVDANANTYWRSGEVSASAPLAWLRVDLGAALLIGRAVIKWSGSYYAKDYDLQVSNDEANWTTVYSSTNSQSVQDFTFPPSTAQYVRLYLKNYNLIDYRVLELQVYPPATFTSKSSDEDIAETAISGARLPDEFVLQQNYPNPFNPSTMISFTLPEEGKVTVNLYNQTGQLVRTLVDGEMPAGAHSVRWNGRSQLGNAVAAGVYLYRITVTGKNGDLVFSQTQRMTMVK